MPSALVELPDGRKARIDFDTPAQLDQALADLVPGGGNTQPPASALDPRTVGAAAETALAIGSGGIAAPIAGLAGLATAGGRALGLTNADPADVVRGTQEAMTYQPRSVGGQAATRAIAWPFEKLAQGADRIGQSVVNATGSPMLGAATNTAIQAAPLVLLRGKRGQAVPDEAANAAQAAEQAARDYAGSLSLDWSALPRAFKAQLTEVAKGAGKLDRLDKAAVSRQGQLQSLKVPVPATRGQLTADPVQLRNEGNVSATKAGQPIRDVYVAQNKAILDNLEALKSRTGGKALNPEQVGESVQGAARAKLAAQKAEVKALYAEADRIGETAAPVSPKPLQQLIKETPDVTHLSWVDTWLKKIQAEGRAVSIRELEDLRQAAVARAANGGTDAYYARKVMDTIDRATEGVGGAAYKKARAARKAQAMEFEERAGVARLVDDASRTDRAVALENTWRRTVLNGTLQELRDVKRSLLTGGTAETRAAGRAALRDLRAETIQHIINQATRSVARFEDGTPNVTPAAMKRALDTLGPEKLNEVFGPGTAKRLDAIVNATRIVKTEPPPGFKGSPTFANAIAFLERGLGHVPLVGDIAAGAIRGTIQLREMGRASRDVKAAMGSPLADAARPRPLNALADKGKRPAAASGLASLERERKKTE